MRATPGALIAALLLALAAAGCTASYEGNVHGGAEARQLDDRRFAILATTTGSNRYGTAEEWALLKAAETAVAQGKETFRVIDATVRTKSYGQVRNHGAQEVNMTIEVASAAEAEASGDDYIPASTVIDALGPRIYKDN